MFTQAADFALKAKDRVVNHEPVPGLLHGEAPEWIQSWKLNARIAHGKKLEYESSSDEESDEEEIPMKPPNNIGLSISKSKTTLPYAPDPNDNWDYDEHKMDVDLTYNKVSDMVKKHKEWNSPAKLAQKKNLQARQKKLKAGRTSR